MLSQTAWRIGRAFTKGKKSAPSEFAEVEREADGLSEALQLVAETLNSDGSILDKAEDTTKSAVSTILDSAQRTLSDLESFVARYRIIKPQTGERAWSEIVLANYKTLKWTTEGGDINALRDMLHMHTSTISLTMQAMQSKSLARLERVVVPMAENVESIHDRVHKIDDVHRIMMAIVSASPVLLGVDRVGRLDSIASDGTLSTTDVAGNSTNLIEPGTRGSQSQIHRPDSLKSNTSALFASQWRDNSACYETSAGAFARETVTNGIDWDFESGAPPTSETLIGDRFAGSSASSVAGSQRSFSNTQRRLPQARVSDAPRRESTTLPNFFTRNPEDDTEENSDHVMRATRQSPVSNGGKRRIDSKVLDQTLPPPALSPIRRFDSLPATPTSMLSGSASSSDRHQSHSNTHSPILNADKIGSQRPRKYSSAASSPNIGSLKPTSPSLPDTPVFEKALFRNAAILCDARTTLVEYAQHDPDAEDPRWDTEMVSLCKEARVCVIRKRENRDNGGTRVVASIWTLSDDGEVRCQQKLPEYSETVPYCSFFEPEKVAIPPADGEISLRLHAHNWGDREEKDMKTKWINYVFETEKHAIDFQSAIFGRQLLGSFRTTKTTVIHEGFRGAFAFEEQFANIEVLRLWEEDGVNTPGGSGGVMALLHMGGNFGQGYAKWWMNSARQLVRVKDEHNKFAKLKGIDIRVLKPVEKGGRANGAKSPLTSSDSSGNSVKMSDASGKKGPERNVTGVRIEFKTEEERAKFVDTVKRVQQRVLPLPDI